MVKQKCEAFQNRLVFVVDEEDGPRRTGIGVPRALDVVVGAIVLDNQLHLAQPLLFSWGHGLGVRDSGASSGGGGDFDWACLPLLGRLDFHPGVKGGESGEMLFGLDERSIIDLEFRGGICVVYDHLLSGFDREEPSLLTTALLPSLVVVGLVLASAGRHGVER